MRLNQGHVTLVADVTRCVVKDRFRSTTHGLRPSSAANLERPARRLLRFFPRRIPTGRALLRCSAGFGRGPVHPL
jgi:hypothetical protein